jgi:sugar-specific transcriptional regulator TrmB
MEKLTHILTQLGLSVPEQTIYLSLLHEGQATARLLAARTTITRPSVYDQLKLLRGRGLVVELDIDGKTYFSPTNVEQLEILMTDRIDELETGRATLQTVLPTLLANTNLIQPKIRFFEGRAGLQQLMKDMLWHDRLEILVFWPYTSMLEILGEEFLTWFNVRRQKRKITMRTLWPLEEKKRTSHIFETDEADVRRRYIKKTQATNMSYIIYKNKVMFLSSSQEAFGFIVDSTEFAALMQMQFEVLWENAQRK